AARTSSGLVSRCIACARSDLSGLFELIHRQPRIKMWLNPNYFTFLPLIHAHELLNGGAREFFSVLHNNPRYTRALSIFDKAPGNSCSIISDHTRLRILMPVFDPDDCVEAPHSHRVRGAVDRVKWFIFLQRISQ